MPYAQAHHDDRMLAMQKDGGGRLQPSWEATASERNRKKAGIYFVAGSGRQGNHHNGGGPSKIGRRLTIKSSAQAVLMEREKPAQGRA